MRFVRIWKEPNQKFTWRHVVLFLYWLITVIPMLVLVGVAWLADVVDEFYGIPRRWANADAYRPRPRIPAPELSDEWKARINDGNHD